MVAHPISLDCGGSGSLGGPAGWYISSPSTSLAHERMVGAERVAGFFRRRGPEAGCPAEGGSDRSKDGPFFFATPDRSTVITPEDGTRPAAAAAPNVGDDNRI